MGYKEKDEIIGEDSFDAFNEVLELAVQTNVDFLLLGGDLFHEHSPS
jgi:double-strand break repair protein MRE11